MDGAAENGSLEVVKWLHQNRDEGCTGDALFLAAKVSLVEFSLVDGLVVDGKEGEERGWERGGVGGTRHVSRNGVG